MQSATNSIQVQFGVFVGVYTLIVAFNILQLAVIDKIADSARIGLCLLSLLVKDFCFQIPIVYILYVHSTTLQKGKNSSPQQSGKQI